MKTMLLIAALALLPAAAFAQQPAPDAPQTQAQETQAQAMIQVGQLQQALGQTTLRALETQKRLDAANKEIADLKAKYEPAAKAEAPAPAAAGAPGPAAVAAPVRPPNARLPMPPAPPAATPEPTPPAAPPEAK